MKVGLSLACALACYEPQATTIALARRSEALAHLKRGLHIGQVQDGLSPFGLRLMNRIREEKAKLEIANHA